MKRYRSDTALVKYLVHRYVAAPDLRWSYDLSVVFLEVSLAHRSLVEIAKYFDLL